MRCDYYRHISTHALILAPRAPARLDIAPTVANHVARCALDAQLPRIEQGRIVLPVPEPGVAPWSDVGVELPVLANASAGHPDVAFVGADNQDTTGGFEGFEKQHLHPYPAGPIVVGSYQSYGVGGLPATFFIDPQGLVTASFSGPLDKTTLDHYLALITTI